MNARSPLRWPSILLPLLALVAPPPAASQSAPNVVVFQSDDLGFPHYGFMQRYLLERLGRCADYDRACTTSSDCPGSTCITPSARCRAGGNPCATHADCAVTDACVDARLGFRDPNVVGYEHDDPGIVMPDDTDPRTPPLNRLLTPALDSLAASGHFFPRSHAGGSHCKPALAVTQTGLHLGDMRLQSGVTSPRTASPVLTDWIPSNYLTMGAGKWQYGSTHGEGPLFTARRPWDREMPILTEAGDNARLLVRGTTATSRSLEWVKDFIDCATCADPSKCTLPPDLYARPDSAQLRERIETIQQGGACTPLPFLLYVNVFVPHLNIQPDKYCPYLDRGFGPPDLRKGLCDEAPYTTRSVYCSYDPVFDSNGDGDANDDGVADVPEDYRSCAYTGRMLGAIRDNLPAGAERDWLSANIEYLRFINVFDRVVDEVLVYLKARNVFDNTALVYLTDNGWKLNSAKTYFSENGYRTPIILRNPFDAALPSVDVQCSTASGAPVPGCRPELAHAVDVRATIRDIVCAAGGCDPPPLPEPEPRLDGQPRWSEGRSLREPGPRPCVFPNEAPFAGNPELRGRYRQCMFGRRRGTDSIKPIEGWYVLAEIEDTANPARIHHCKYYRLGCGPASDVFDLTTDPNESRSRPKACRGGAKAGATCTDSTQCAGGVCDPAFCTQEQERLAKVLRVNVACKSWGVSTCATYPAPNVCDTL
jgi:arylsulfatase A-like enzyme